MVFCPKCGTKVLHGAGFCQKCGTKLIVDTPATQPATESPTQSTYQSCDTLTDMSKKKKSTKLPIILCIAALVFMLLIVLAYIGGKEQPTIDNSGSSSSSGKVNLSQSYVNEAEGVSFKYPSGWVLVKKENYDDYVYLDGSEYLAILVNETEDLPEEYSIIIVRKDSATQNDMDMLSMSDDDFIEVVENSGISIKNTSTLKLDGVPARKYTAVDSEGNGYTIYAYINGSNLYLIEFDWVGENPGSKQRFFDAMIDSYTIAASTSTIGSDTDAPANNLPVLPAGFEWVEEPSWTTDSYSVKVTGVIKNTSGKTKNYVEITFNVYDSNGYRIGSAWANIADLSAGSSWKFEALSPGTAESAASVEFASLSGW